MIEQSIMLGGSAGHRCCYCYCYFWLPAIVTSVLLLHDVQAEMVKTAE